MAIDNAKIAQDVLAAVGGADNITSATHCMTRLRLNLKDQSIPKDDEVKKIKGVLGAQWSGGQYQVIIGQNVPKVYDAALALGVPGEGSIDENLDPSLPKEKLTPRVIGQNTLNYLSKSMVALIPLMMGSSLFKAVSAILGPEMLGLITAESNLYLLCDALFKAGFYFMPIYLGYSAAKTLGMLPVLGMLMGGILLSPGFTAVVGQPFDIYGIPTTIYDYSQSVLPILLSVWVMSYVVRFFKRIIPDTLSTIFVPFLSVVVMVPISLCVLAPIGNHGGVLISNFILSLDGGAGVFAAILIGGAWEFLVMTGMHVTIAMFSMTAFLENGSMSGALIAATFATISVWGMSFGASLRLKDKEEKALSFGYFISGIIGGVTEPGLYGLGFKYRRAFIGMIVGGAVAGAYGAITGVTQYVMAGAANALMVIAFTGGSAQNLINAIIACVLAFVVAAVVTYLFGFSKEDLEQVSE